MPDVISSCPRCGGPLEVRELGCASCGTRLSGTFSQCPFCALTCEERRAVIAALRHCIKRKTRNAAALGDVVRKILAAQDSAPSAHCETRESTKGLSETGQLSAQGGAERKKRRIDILRELSRGATLKTK